MNTEWKPGWSQGPQASEEGQTKDTLGNKSDHDFHHVAFGTDAVQAANDLELLAEASIETSEQQAEYLSSIDHQIGIRAFQHLIRMHPKHPRVTHWESRIQELNSTPTV